MKFKRGDLVYVTGMAVDPYFTVVNGGRDGEYQAEDLGDVTLIMTYEQDELTHAVMSFVGPIACDVGA